MTDDKLILDDRRPKIDLETGKIVREYMRFPKPLFYLIQATWGFTQNLAGGIGYLALKGKYPQERYHESFVTYVKKEGFGGVSLGCFIFLNPKTEAYKHDGLIHEFGHTIQSLALGWLYWPVVAIPSFIWCNVPALERYRNENKVSYYQLYCERWANRWGSKWTGEEFCGAEIQKYQ